MNLENRERLGAPGFLERLDRAEKEVVRFRATLAVFAESKSWKYDAEIIGGESQIIIIWNKMGDFADPRELARRALEGE